MKPLKSPTLILFFTAIALLPPVIFTGRGHMVIVYSISLQFHSNCRWPFGGLKNQKSELLICKLQSSAVVALQVAAKMAQLLLLPLIRLGQPQQFKITKDARPSSSNFDHCSSYQSKSSCSGLSDAGVCILERWSQREAGVMLPQIPIKRSNFRLVRSQMECRSDTISSYTTRSNTKLIKSASRRESLFMAFQREIINQPKMIDLVAIESIKMKPPKSPNLLVFFMVTALLPCVVFFSD